MAAVTDLRTHEQGVPPPEATRRTAALIGIVVGLAAVAVYSTRLFQPFDPDGATNVGWYIHYPGVLRIFRTNTAYSNHLLFTLRGEVCVLGLREQPRRSHPESCSDRIRRCERRFAHRGHHPSWGVLRGIAAGLVLGTNLMFVSQAAAIRGYSMVVFFALVLDRGAVAHDACSGSEATRHDRLCALGGGRHRDARLHGARRDPPSGVRAGAPETDCSLDQDVRVRRCPWPSALCRLGQGHGSPTMASAAGSGSGFPNDRPVLLVGRNGGCGRHRGGALGGRRRSRSGGVVSGCYVGIPLVRDARVHVADLAALHPRHPVLHLGHPCGRGGDRLATRRYPGLAGPRCAS